MPHPGYVSGNPFTSELDATVTDAFNTTFTDAAVLTHVTTGVPAADGDLVAAFSPATGFGATLGFKGTNTVGGVTGTTQYMGSAGFLWRQTNGTDRSEFAVFDNTGARCLTASSSGGVSVSTASTVMPLAADANDAGGLAITYTNLTDSLRVSHSIGYGGAVDAATIAGAGFGAAVVFRHLFSLSGTADLARIGALYTDAGDGRGAGAARATDIVFQTITAGAALAEVFRVSGTNGSKFSGKLGIKINPTYYVDASDAVSTGGVVRIAATNTSNTGSASVTVFNDLGNALQFFKCGSAFVAFASLAGVNTPGTSFLYDGSNDIAVASGFGSVYVSSAGVVRAKYDTQAEAAKTTAWLLSENGTLKRVTIGANDSGGAGFSVLRVVN